MTISKVWINEGCISCRTCEVMCPDVFHVTDDGDCLIRDSVRTDGITSNNRNEKATLKFDLDPKLESEIINTAIKCPVKIIQIALMENETESKITSKEESQTHSSIQNNSRHQDKRAIIQTILPLPSLKLHLEAMKSCQEDANANSTSTKSTMGGDIVAPLPAAATDVDLIKLKALLEHKVEEVFQQAGEITCQVAKESILEALALCRNDSSLKYEMLADQTATHYPTAKDFAFSIVYHLTSIRRSKRLRIRILIPERYEPDSAVAIYPSANWMEREIWDMLGIKFKNHPNMTRILCPEDWEGHALRKDYPVEGLGQRNINFREDRGGMLMRIATEKANNIKINTNPSESE